MDAAANTLAVIMAGEDSEHLHMDMPAEAL